MSVNRADTVVHSTTIDTAATVDLVRPNML
jgi:hypothetical protein